MERVKEQVRIRDLLKTNPKGLTIEDVSKKLSLSRPTAAKYLNSMVLSGQADMRTLGPAKIFCLTQRLPLANLLSLASDLILILDSDLFIQEVNTTFLNYFHLSKKELKGSKIEYSPLAPYFTQEHLTALERALEGTILFFEIHFDISNIEGYFKMKCIPLVLDGGGRAVGVILEDITEMKKFHKVSEEGVSERTADLVKTTDMLENEIKDCRPEEALRESEKKIRAIFDSTVQFTGMMTPEGILMLANHTALEFVGARMENVINRPFWETPWWRGDAARVQRLREAIGNAAIGKFVRYEVELQGVGSTTMLVDFSIKPIFDQDGKMQFLIPEARDITGCMLTEAVLRESEKCIAQIINFLTDATFAIDRKGQVIAWNRRMEEMTGVLAQEMIGKSDHQYAIPFYGVRRPILIDLVFYPEEEIRQNYSFVQVEEAGITAETITVSLRGKKIILRGKAIPLYDTKGNVIGAIETIRDITEQR